MCGSDLLDYKTLLFLLGITRKLLELLGNVYSLSASYSYVACICKQMYDLLHFEKALPAGKKRLVLIEDGPPQGVAPAVPKGHLRDEPRHACFLIPVPPFANCWHRGGGPNASESILPCLT